MLKSWKSKKKKRQITWAALRSGFLKRDWAKAFVDELQRFDLPGEDYLLLAPKTNLLGFTRSPARWVDAERGIHAALVEVGVPVDDAITYSLHSFKHLLVTAGKQLVCRNLWWMLWQDGRSSRPVGCLRSVTRLLQLLS